MTNDDLIARLRILASNITGTLREAADALERADDERDSAAKSLRAERDALLKDAERYRWLKATPWTSATWEIVAAESPALWDDAIDAALAKGEG
jgi:hypothetical protein